MSSSLHFSNLHLQSIFCYRQEEKGPVLAILLTALYSLEGQKSDSKLINTDNNVHHIPYSDHCSHSELLEFVGRVRPHTIYPIVVANTPNPVKSNEDFPYDEHLKNVLNSSMIPRSILSLARHSDSVLTISCTMPILKSEYLSKKYKSELCEQKGNIVQHWEAQQCGKVDSNPLAATSQNTNNTQDDFLSCEVQSSNTVEDEIYLTCDESITQESKTLHSSGNEPSNNSSIDDILEFQGVAEVLNNMDGNKCFGLVSCSNLYNYNQGKIINKTEDLAETEYTKAKKYYESSNEGDAGYSASTESNSCKIQAQDQVMLAKGSSFAYVPVQSGPVPNKNRIGVLCVQSTPLINSNNSIDQPVGYNNTSISVEYESMSEKEYNKHFKEKYKCDDSSYVDCNPNLKNKQTQTPIFPFPTGNENNGQVANVCPFTIYDRIIDPNSTCKELFLSNCDLTSQSPRSRNTSLRHVSRPCGIRVSEVQKTVDKEIPIENFDYANKSHSVNEEQRQNSILFSTNHRFAETLSHLIAVNEIHDSSSSCEELLGIHSDKYISLIPPKKRRRLAQHGNPSGTNKSELQALNVSKELTIVSLPPSSCSSYNTCDINSITCNNTIKTSQPRKHTDSSNAFENNHSEMDKGIITHPNNVSVCWDKILNPRVCNKSMLVPVTDRMVHFDTGSTVTQTPLAVNECGTQDTDYNSKESEQHMSELSVRLGAADKSVLQTDSHSKVLVTNEKNKTHSGELARFKQLVNKACTINPITENYPDIWHMYDWKSILEKRKE